MRKILLVCAMILGVSVNAWATIVPYAGQGSPVIGASVIATGGEVIATYLTGSGLYDDYLYLASPANPHQNANPALVGGNWIFLNHGSVTGDQVDLGNFAAGTELIFNVLAGPNVGLDLNWYTGPASRNADGYAHAWVDAAYTGPYGGTAVGFEDLAGLGDAGFEDLRYTFSNVKSDTTAVPEPGTFLLLGVGLAGAGLLRRKIRI